MDRKDGIPEGSNVGLVVGTKVGATDIHFDGIDIGIGVAICVGDGVGSCVGRYLGSAIGIIDGRRLRMIDGIPEGWP